MSRDLSHADAAFDRGNDDATSDRRTHDVTREDADDVARRTAASDDEMVYADGREADDGWLGVGLAGILLVTGVLLFLFPEPATSMLGIGLVVAGLVVWIASRAR